MKVSKQERKMFSRCKWCTTCDKDSLTNQTLLRLPWTLFQLWLTFRFCYPSLHCLTLAWTLLSQFNQKVPPLNICWGFSSSTTPLGTSGHPCLPSVRILSGWFGQNHPPFPTPPTSNASLSQSFSIQWTLPCSLAINSHVPIEFNLNLPPNGDHWGSPTPITITPSLNSLPYCTLTSVTELLLFFNSLKNFFLNTYLIRGRKWK